MQRFCAFCTTFVLALAASGCSEDSNPNSGNGGSGATDGGNADFAHGGPGTCAGSFLPTNNESCAGSSVAVGSCANPPDCESGRPIESCCVSVGEPGRDPSNRHLVRTTDTKEYSDPTGAPPNLGCFDPGGYPPKPPATSSGTATLTGVIKPFANGGCDETGLVGVVMEVYTVNRTGDPATDGTLEAVVGSPLTVDATMPIELEDVDNCSDDPRPNRVYTYPGVPMDTELVIKTFSADTRWRPLYTYNIYVTASDPAYAAATGEYTYDVRALASDDFNTIPTAAIGKTISAGNAAIGGEVHDCDNVRLRFARVDITLDRVDLVYFNDNEDDPLPDSNRKQIGTGSTALYSALDVTVQGDSSFFRVAGTGLVPDENGGSKLVTLGYFDARAYPNSVTSVTLRGLRPFQVP